VLKACLNGGLGRDRHPAVPVTAAELAADAAACRAAGALAVHVHPRDGDGRETLDAAAVAAAVEAIRRASPGLPVGVSTGAWIEPDPAARVDAIGSWTVLPDFASVNAHEPGAASVAAALHRRGVGVEAGLWTADAVAAYLTWRTPCLRVLLELMVPDPAAAIANAHRMLDLLPPGRPPAPPGPSAQPVLLHAEGPAVWPVLTEAVALGLDTRIGLEDTRALPDGTPAPDNAALVAAAVATGAR
jgi:uncharacterized protein (DUF849 family)